MKKFGDQSPETKETTEDGLPVLEVGDYGAGGRDAYLAAMNGSGAAAGSAQKTADAAIFGEFPGLDEKELQAAAESAAPASGAGADDGEGMDLLAIYLEEVKAIPPVTEAEEKRLAERAAAGDPAARDRLTEGYLMHALSLLKDFMGGPLSVSEMIGISNLSLVKAVRGYLEKTAAAGNSGKSPLESASLRDTITETVREDLLAAGAAEKRFSEGAGEVAAKANRLTEVSRVMASELGRQATEEELAERMRITPDEVRELLKMTMQALDAGSGLG